MSSNAATARVQDALATIHTIAETKNPESSIVTSTLDIIQRWGKIRKIVWYCFLDEYFNQVNPYKSTKLFKMTFQNPEYLFLLVLLVPVIYWYLKEIRKSDASLQISSNASL